MRLVLDYLDRMENELEDAKEFAESFLQYKAENKIDLAEKYKEMSEDELKHASYIRDISIKKFDELKSCYIPPVKLEEIWSKKQIKFIEDTAWIKQMLSM